MKKNIHPKYYNKATVECACGNKFETGSTKEYIRVEICSACHPFYTGKHKLVDTAGRVDKFKAKVEKAAKAKAQKEAREKQKKTKVVKTKKVERDKPNENQPKAGPPGAEKAEQKPGKK